MSNELKPSGYEKQEVYVFDTKLTTTDELTGKITERIIKIGIWFKNGHYCHVDFDIPGKRYMTYCRNEWKILKFIEEKITELETQIG